MKKRSKDPLDEIFVKNCPYCHGKGYVRNNMGRCKNGERCQFTNPLGQRLDNCFKCHRPYGYQKKNKKVSEVFER